MSKAKAFFNKSSKSLFKKIEIIFFEKQINKHSSNRFKNQI